MRVTDAFRYRSVTRNLNTGRERVTDLQEKLATGKRINRPSDDPIAIAKTLKLRTFLENNEQYQNNIKDSITQLTVQEEALNQVHEIVAQLKEITIHGASDTITIRESLALQVGQMLDNMLEIANTKFNGKYIFGGTETLTQPFAANQNVLNFGADEPVVDYYGNTEKVNRQINEKTVVAVNLNGKEVFDQSLSGGIDIFQMMYDLKDNLENEDSLAINGQIDDVDTALEQVLGSYLSVGTRKQLVTFNEERFVGQNIQLKATMSHLEDTDFGEAFIAFKAEENALNSALSAGARVVSPSLIDFIGGV